ncbi:MAG: response regulator [Bacteroidota bacterium]
MTKIRVLVVEDEPLIAEDIREYLDNIDYEVEALAYSLEDALTALKNTKPDVALLDINLGGEGMEGFQIANEINLNHQIPFIFLTSYSSKQVVEQAKATRPMGYLVKPFDESDLFTSIEIAMYNHSQIHKPRSFSKEHLNPLLHTPLTQKEFEILEDIYEGRTNKQMADKHFISLNTIKTHVKNIYDKMETNTRSSTIAKVRELLG